MNRGRQRGALGRGSGRGGREGRGQQRWWDPAWRAERLAKIAAERGPVLEFNQIEWTKNIQSFLQDSSTSEIKITQNYGRDGADPLKELAEQHMLHFKTYGKGTNTVHVISKKMLPNYRADLDRKHGTSTSQIEIDVQTATKVESLMKCAKRSHGMDESGPATSSLALQTRAIEHKKPKSKVDPKTQPELKQIMETSPLWEFRKTLPAFKVRDQFLKAVANNQVVIISGETGCGKTTQLPNFLLEERTRSQSAENVNVFVTQPRRISAVSVSERVANERGEPLGGTVGYQIRLESRTSQLTRLTFVTTGVLIRRIEEDGHLLGISHVFVDEVHERGINEDVLMVLLKGMLRRREDLRVVLMSATINAASFSAYFNNAPLIHIPGAAHPVAQYFLEDIIQLNGVSPHSPPHRQSQKPNLEHLDAKISALWKDTSFFNKHYSNLPSEVKSKLKSWSPDSVDLQLVERVVEHICECQAPGAVLVFLPGWEEISKLVEALKGNPVVAKRSVVLPLHGSMPSVNQREIFTQPPIGFRKIIVSTNIAETSVTIEDIVYVVDCGRAKLNTYDALNKLSLMDCTWVSQASCRQRKGRAGRVRPGVCYHVFPYALFLELPEFPVPEMLRAPLHELALKIKSLGHENVEKFLEASMDPPDPLAVKSALDHLEAIGAIDSHHELSPLGRHLARLPLDPRLGKLLLYGCFFLCLDPILTVGAGFGTRDPFVLPLEKRREVDLVKRRFGGSHGSDHMMLINAYNGWVEAKRQGRSSSYCWDNFLSEKTLQMIADTRLQFLDILRDIGFVDKKHNLQEYNENSNEPGMIKSVLCAGFFPCVAQIKRRGKNRLCFYTPDDGLVDIHPSSVNGNLDLQSRNARYLAFGQKVKTTKIFVRDSTIISQISLLIFGGELALNKEGNGFEMLNGYFQFSGSHSTIDLIQDLRNQLNSLFLQKVKNPLLNVNELGRPIVKAVLQLLKCSD